MSTVVMAVIAVLVLIILTSIVVRTLGDTAQTTTTCETKGGKCTLEADGCAAQTNGYTQQKTGDQWVCLTKATAGNPAVKDPKQVCCVPG